MMMVLAISKYNLHFMDKIKLSQLEDPQWLDAPALNRVIHPLEEQSESPFGEREEG